MPKRITELPSKRTPLSLSDLLELVSISDTTDTAGGSSIRITLQELHTLLTTTPASPFLTFGNWGLDDNIPEDGSILTQAVLNRDTGFVYINFNWPDTDNPDWNAH